jgi:hypothetical protein
MPIEFQCTACSRTLRVPDGTAGKFSRCPGCSERLQIPDFNEPSDVGAVQDRQGVPCPKCRATLECDSSLDGTRGCCKSCAHVFTIRFQADVQDVLEDDSIFPFACPRCKQLFEGTPDKEGRKGKCTNCAEIFTIERYVPVKPVDILPKPVPNLKNLKPKPATPAVLSSPTKAPKPKTFQDLRPTLPKPQEARIEQPASFQQDGFANLGDFLPPTQASHSVPSNTWVEQNVSTPSYMPPPSPAKQRPRKKQGSGSTIKLVLSILGAVMGVCVLLCCGGGGAFYFYVTSTKTISAGGYSADAPGMPFEPTIRDATVSGKAISNPRTRSEFMIATVSSAVGRDASIENYVAYLKSTGMASDQDVSSSERAGLRGFRVKTRRTASMPPSITEIFEVNGKILMMVYVNGAVGAKLKGLRTTLTESDAEAIDVPEQFFQSLRVSP